MVNHFKGDLTQFRMHDVASFAKQTLVRANEHDSLLHVLRVMATSRISVLPIERKIED
jgi:CBS domain-containing protein